jgi:hypothetical protein
VCFAGLLLLSRGGEWDAPPVPTVTEDYPELQKSGVLDDKAFTNKTGRVLSHESFNKGGSGALKDFYDLPLSDVKTYSNGTTVGRLPDGTTANVRPTSSTNNRTGETSGPTLEIYNPKTETSVKIRY